MFLCGAVDAYRREKRFRIVIKTILLAYIAQQCVSGAYPQIVLAILAYLRNGTVHHCHYLITVVACQSGVGTYPQGSATVGQQTGYVAVGQSLPRSYIPEFACALFGKAVTGSRHRDDI